jgi:diacylglycerol kinase (ATP)
MVKRYFFIINPRSGKGISTKIWNQLKEILIDKKIELNFSFTEFEKHAIELSAIACINNDVIIAIGGDGTIHEVANGIINSKLNRELGMIPVGTGNDFASSHGVPIKLNEQLDLILSDKTKVQDVIEIQHTSRKLYCISMFGAGLDASIAQKANEKKKIKGGGKSIYISSALQSVFKYKPIKLSFEIDDKLNEVDILTLAVGIHKRNGGGIIQCPDAICDDGYMNLSIIKPLTFIDVLTILPKLYSGKIYSHKKTQHQISKQIMLNNENILSEADGETVGKGNVKLTLVSKAIEVKSNLL